MGPDDGRIEELLRVLDHPVPEVTADAIARRAARPRLLPARWAAAVLLALAAAGAAFALPGSPLRRWVAAFADRLGRGPVAHPPHPAQQSDGGAGIAVAPGNALLILFDDSAAGSVRVALSDRADVLVRAGAGRASFTSGGARLLIETRGVPDTFTVDVPRAAARVEIRAGPSRLFLKERERVTAPVAPDTAGVYRLPLSRAHP